jgi:hypothetical protein
MRDFPVWTFFWAVGLVLALVAIPALLGFFAGTRVEQYSRAVPWRVLFVAIAVALGGMVAWRLIVRRPG